MITEKEKIQVMKEEIKCLSVMLSKESERHICTINPLLERQLYLLGKIRMAGDRVYNPVITSRGCSNI